jgi:hypothetical protein
MDELVTASQAMATRLYQQQAAASQQGEPAEAEDEPGDDDVVEAEIIDDEDA